jgi:Fe-S-cluster containining protein
MGDRCTGQCCKSFFLPFSPIELRRLYKAALAAEPGDVQVWYREDGTEMRTWYDRNEVLKIGSMVVHLGFFTDRTADKHPTGDVMTDGHYYTCKHFEAATGNCLNYENRPLMCSDFPYSKPCPHEDRCRWDVARAGLHPPKPEVQRAAI